MQQERGVRYVVETRRYGVIENKLHLNALDPESRAVEGKYHVDVPEGIMDACQYVASWGGRALVVGGAVRDEVVRQDLGEQVKTKDFDLEIYGLEPAVLVQILESRFGPIGIEGQKYRIMKVSVPGIPGKVDMSVPRTERSVGAGSRDFAIIGNVGMNIKEAASRRDLTVNTLAYDPLSGILYDPFDGLADVKARQLRMANPEAFGEDPMRVMRLVQIAPRLGFSVEPETKKLATRMVESGALDGEVRERWTEEVFKLLVKAKRPSEGLQLAREFGIVQRYWPELAVLPGVPQEPDWHPEGDVWKHTLQVVDAAAAIRDREQMEDVQAFGFMLGALLHDVGKALKTTVRESDGRIISHGHEAAGREPAMSFLKRFKLPKIVERQVLGYVTEHMQPGEIWRQHVRGEETAGWMRRTADRLSGVSLNLEMLALVAEADSRGRNSFSNTPLTREEAISDVRQEWFLAEAKRLGVQESAPQPILLGRHILEMWPEKRPGKWVGEILSYVRSLQLDGVVVSLEQAQQAAQDFVSR